MAKPDYSERQWFLGATSDTWHLRDLSVKLPSVRVACGASISVDDLLGFAVVYEMPLAVSYQTTCPECLKRLKAQEQEPQEKGE